MCPFLTFFPSCQLFEQFNLTHNELNISGISKIRNGIAMFIHQHILFEKTGHAYSAVIKVAIQCFHD